MATRQSSNNFGIAKTRSEAKKKLMKHLLVSLQSARKSPGDEALIRQASGLEIRFLNDKEYRTWINALDDVERHLTRWAGIKVEGETNPYAPRPKKRKNE